MEQRKKKFLSISDSFIAFNELTEANVRDFVKAVADVEQNTKSEF